jgi:hypothetical protein
VQVLSLVALGNFSSWIWDMFNWLDVLNILFIYYFGAIPLMSMEAFWPGVAVTKGILWMSVTSFLKSTQVEFSVFVSGVFYVVQRLAAFILALLVILLMFAQMFYLVYAESDMCKCTLDSVDASPFPLFRFIVAIEGVHHDDGRDQQRDALLHSPRRAIPVHYVRVPRHHPAQQRPDRDLHRLVRRHQERSRGHMVFWSNRLDFVADAIKNIGSSIKKYFRPGGSGAAGAPRRVRETPNGEPIPISDEKRGDVDCFGNAWKRLMNLFDPNLYESYDVSPSSFEFWCYILVRFAAVEYPSGSSSASRAPDGYGRRR